MIPFELLQDVKEEFSIRLSDGSNLSHKALNTIGLDVNETDVGLVLAKLQEFEDEYQRNKIGTVLFGTQYEDILYYIEPKHSVDRGLLTIKLNDIDSVPEVYYEGKRINYLSRLRLGWVTRADEPLKDSTMLEITYALAEAKPNFRTIGYNM